MAAGILGNPGNAQSFSDGGLGSMFQGGNNRAMEASLKEFLGRPENQAVMERQQRKEVKQAMQLQQKMQALQFRDKVLESEYEAQKAVAPFLGNRVLRRIVQTFANDPKGDFAKWALNPEVIQMLTLAKQRMEQGYMSEAEVEELLLRQLQDPQHEAHEDFKAKTKRVARLATDQLVGALNEHLTERRAGNEAYRARDWSKALHHYKRAAGVVEFVEALSSADQEEIDLNKVAAYLNLAATYMALQEHGTAASYCTKALEVDPQSGKALLRRSRAHTARHEYAAAAADLDALRALGDPAWEAEAAEQERAVERARAEHKRREAATFANMFDRGSK